MTWITAIHYTLANSYRADLETSSKTGQNQRENTIPLRGLKAVSLIYKVTNPMFYIILQTGHISKVCSTTVFKKFGSHINLK